MKRPASAPPLIEYTAVPPSTSVEVTVVTAVWFSAALVAAVAPAPLLVITGASLTGVTLTLSDSVKVSTPPLAVPPLSTTFQLKVAGPPLAFAVGLNFMPCSCASV